MTGDEGSTDVLRELGKDLPWQRPDVARREALRSSLLVAAGESENSVPRKRWLVVGGAFAAGVVAAAAIALVVMDSSDRTTAPQPQSSAEIAPYAQIEASSAAEIERTRVASSTGIDETVRIRAGSVRLVVPAVRTGDHVRARTGDAEVEGTGAFEIVVVADALNRVSVSSGTASIRIKSESQPVFLSAGESWQAKVITASIDVTPPAPPAIAAPANETPNRAPAQRRTTDAVRVEAARIETARVEPVESARIDPAPVTAIASSPTTAPPAPLAKGRTETERHFQAGLALERAGKHAEAAIELGLAADAGSDELAVDARYFQAVSLVKAGLGAAAEKAIVNFLDHAPRSVRRGRAAVMLGRLLADRGSTIAARQWYEAAKDDPDPSVAAAARHGLDSLR